jgi:hypothetical protein
MVSPGCDRLFQSTPPHGERPRPHQSLRNQPLPPSVPRTLESVEPMESLDHPMTPARFFVLNSFPPPRTARGGIMPAPGSRGRSLQDPGKWQGCRLACFAERSRAGKLPQSCSTHRSQPAAHRSQPAAHPSQPAAHRSQPVAHRSQPVAHRSQPAAHRSQPVAHRSQPVAHRSQPAAHRSQPCAHRSQPVAHRSQPAAHRSQPAAHRSHLNKEVFLTRRGGLRGPGCS